MFQVLHFNIFQCSSIEIDIVLWPGHGDLVMQIQWEVLHRVLDTQLIDHGNHGWVKMHRLSRFCDLSCCVNGQAKVVMPSTHLSLNVKKDFSVRRRISAKGSSSKTHRVKNPQRDTVTRRRGRKISVAPCNRPIRMTNNTK